MQLSLQNILWSFFFFKRLSQAWRWQQCRQDGAWVHASLPQPAAVLPGQTDSGAERHQVRLLRQARRRGEYLLLSWISVGLVWLRCSSHLYFNTKRICKHLFINHQHAASFMINGIVKKGNTLSYSNLWMPRDIKWPFIIKRWFRFRRVLGWQKLSFSPRWETGNGDIFCWKRTQWVTSSLIW